MAVHDRLQSTPGTASDLAASWTVKCLNCGATLAGGGHFCAECGQRAMPPHPTMRELVGDALAEFSGWDGKFAGTIRMLLAKPGELTRQWLEGRRVHYISPLRLYLTASVLYFLVAAAAPNLRPKKGGFGVPGIQFGPTITSGPQRVADRTQSALDAGKPLTPKERQEAIRDIAKAPWIMRPMLTKAIDDPNAMKAGVFRWFPRILFALLPVYAGILAAFYRRRNYPEHLYFAIHLHAFVFVALALSNLVKFTRLSAVAIGASVVAGLWIVSYSVIALRRVYGGSVSGTVAKGLGIVALYGLILIPALIGVVLLSAF